MKWALEEINLLEEIQELFAKTKAPNTQKITVNGPLFEHTQVCMAWGGGGDPIPIYYSAGIERPEYNNSIRIMSRYTRDRSC